jgi:F0F1-type ATP synthase membrane subunit c/vacuolar-type H+-ATPase subunit K
MIFAENADSVVMAARYLGAGIAMGFGAIGSGVGEGYIAGFAAVGISRQPENNRSILRTMLVGQAISETAGIFALVMAVMMIFVNPFQVTDVNFVAVSAGLIGCGFAMGLGALGSGIGMGVCGAKACDGISRHPSNQSNVQTFLLIGSALASNPAIFGLVISLLMFLIFNYAGVTVQSSLLVSGALLAAGFSVGFGAIGSGLGMGFCGGGACEAVAKYPESGSNVRMMMLLGSAIAGNPAVFGLLVAFLLLFKDYSAGGDIASFMALLGAGLSMGLGAIGSGLGCGIPGGAACLTVARKPSTKVSVMRTMLIGQALSGSVSVLALVVALLLYSQ